MTLAAGRIDPSSGLSRAEVAESLRDVAWLLRTHAEHEDNSIQPTLEEHLPDLAERVVADHERLDRRIEDLERAEQGDSSGVDTHPAPYRATDASCRSPGLPPSLHGAIGRRSVLTRALQRPAPARGWNPAGVPAW